MKIAIIGSGGREHALVATISKSSSLTEMSNIICSPCNLKTVGRRSSHQQQLAGDVQILFQSNALGLPIPHQKISPKTAKQIKTSKFCYCFGFRGCS